MSNAGLVDAASALEAMAAGIEPNRAELVSGARALDEYVSDKEVSIDLRLARTSLSLWAYSGSFFLGKAVRNNAGRAADEVRGLMAAQS